MIDFIKGIVTTWNGSIDWVELTVFVVIALIILVYFARVGFAR